MNATPFTREAARDRPTGIWDYVSPSRLNLWLRCPLAFRFRYIDGVATPTSPAQYVGKLVHAGLEHHYRHRQVGVTLPMDELCSRLEDLWDQMDSLERVAFYTSVDETNARVQAKELVRTYLSQLPAEEPRPVAVESALEAPLVDPATGEDLGISLVGIVDLVLPEPGGPLIADFKTVARGGESLEITHEVQLGSYAYLFRQASGQIESGLEIRNVIKTKVPRVETHRFGPRDETHFRRLFAVIRAYLDDLDRGRFVYRPGHMCSMCEHRNTRCNGWAG